MQQDYPKIVSNRLRFCYNRMYCSDSGLHKQGGFSNFAIPKFNSSLMTNADTDIQELSNFLLDFATTLMGVGSHSSRVVRNVNRIAESFGYGVDMTIFQRNITMTVKHADDYSIRRTYVRRIPALALNFRTISDLSSLSWEAYDHDLPLDELKKRYEVSAYPTFLVIDADGTMVHRFVGYRTANDLLSELDYDPSSAWGAIQTRYDSGERDKEFLLQYLNLLMGASDKRAGKVAGELFAALDDDEKVSEKYAFLFQNLSLNTVGSDIYAYFLANRPRYEKAMGEKTVYNLLVRCNTEYLRWSSFEKQDLTPGERATIQKNLDAAGMTELYPFWNVVQACRAGDFNRLIKACRQNFPKMDRHLAFSYYSMFLANMRKDGAPAQQKACDKILEELKNRPIE